MSSRVLYPPIVDSYMPAFETSANSNSYCDVYFRLSKFNAVSDFSSVHATIVKQSTNMNVVKKTDDPESGRYRSTGIILNIKPSAVANEDNLYYIRINSSDLYSKTDNFEGWIPDWTYKIQIRLSSKDYDGSIGQSAWLNANASEFSEWSTICVVKAINHITYTLDALGIDTSNENESSNDKTTVTLYSSTLVASGRFENYGSEDIYLYNFILYDENDNIVENSGSIYANQFQDNKSFNYLFKKELIDGHTYKLEFKYETVNHFIGGAYKYTTNDGTEIDKRYEFIVSVAEIGTVNCVLITAENDPNSILEEITSIHQEEEDGRIGVKFYAEVGELFSGNLCIRRADSKDNFQTWTDIKIIIVKAQDVNTLPIYYDYTAESGVWYKYGVQKIDKDGSRGQMNVINNAVLRNYNYSYLLGKNNQQLRLMFDNTMGNFKIQLQESSNDPIGSQFSVTTRNAATRYKIFPLNGLISFWMDENELFCNKKVIYTYDDIVAKYNKYNEDNNIIQYDYIYERDFRKLVLDFLHNGEFKLFKSPTEGNIIVRLTDINCTPNQSLDRMVYSFTSTAREMAEATMDNYRTYGFYDPGEYGTDFSILETRIGQLQMDFPIGTNIFEKIYSKYDSQGKNVGGYNKVLKNIHHIKITFEDRPLRITNAAGEYVIGNNFTLNGQQFTVYEPVRIYEFDENLIYNALDSLIFLGDAERKVTTVRATVDFLYDMTTEVYQAKQIQERTVKSGIGQIFNEYLPNYNIYNEIYYKYYIESEKSFRRLNTISSIEIEANPGCIFSVKDASDTVAEEHVIGDTGQLRFTDLSNINGIKYVGILVNGVKNTTRKADVLINYEYVATKGSYKVIS